jgi:Sporulation and spore germination/Putative peptidoglycan binding domain
MTMTRPTLTMLVATGLVVGLLGAGGGSALAAKPRLSVYFVRGEQVARVTRSGATALDAVRALLRGPTRAEASRGFRTYVPGHTGPEREGVRQVATADLNERFAAGRDTGSLLARLAELVRTLTGVQGTRKVQLLINGRVAAARFPGVSTGKPISFRDLQKPNVPVPEPPPYRLPPPDPAVKALQQRLIQLGYMIRGDDDGQFGPATQNAILGFQKWERLPPIRPPTAACDRPSASRAGLTTSRRSACRSRSSRDRDPDCAWLFSRVALPG